MQHTGFHCGMAMGVVLCAVHLAAATPSAGVQAQSEPVQITFSAPDTCATEDAFYAAIRSRTALFEATRAKSDRGFDVAIRDQGETFLGALVVHSPGATSERRELRTRSCEEILETFALIIAVAVDPNARLSAAPIPISPPPKATAEFQAPIPPSPPTAAAIAPAAPRRTVEDRSKRSWFARGSVGAAGMVSLYFSPFVELGLGTLLERPGALGYDVRLSLVRTLPVTVIDERERHVSYALTTARPELALNLSSSSGKLVFGAGVGADLGTVSLDATQTNGGSKSSRAWVAVLAASTLRWVATTVVAAELQFGGAVPLIRDQYRLIDPVAYVEKPASFGGFMSFGLTARIW